MKNDGVMDANIICSKQWNFVFLRRRRT